MSIPLCVKTITFLLSYTFYIIESIDIEQKFEFEFLVEHPFRGSLSPKRVFIK